MTSVRYRDLLRAPVVSSDAYLIGEVDGIRYNANDWISEFLLVAIRRGLSHDLTAGKSPLSASRALVPMDNIQAGRQAFLLYDSLAELEEESLPENTNIPNLSNLLGKKVVTKGNQALGTLYDLEIEMGSNWEVLEMVVRLEKTMSEPLGIKKPLLSRLPDIVLDVDTIANITEIVQLDLDLSDIRESMRIVE